MSGRAEIGLVDSDEDLQGILALQRASRAPTEDGFVTVQHDLEILRAMHALAPSVVARDQERKVVGYALMMPRETRALLPILEPMFQEIEQLPAGVLASLANPRWYVMGQIAVAPDHRGTGVFDALYAGHREHHRERFDVVVTEIASRNPRSLRAHQRVGFRSVHTYKDATDDWVIVAWAFDPSI